VTKDLSEEVKKLNKRIEELEKMLSTIVEPLKGVRDITQNYLKIAGIIMDKGGLTPDAVLPEIKDSISQEIVRVLLDRSGQNISQITELVRTRRGTASRRIIREKISYLIEKDIIQKTFKGSIPVYSLTDKVIKKWSQMLGFKIWNDHPYKD